MSEGLAIPGAPPPEVLWTYAAYHVQRVRAHLLYRAAERRDQPTAAHRQAFEAAGHQLAGIEGEYPVPFVALADALALSSAERSALAIIAAPHLDPTLRGAITAYWGAARAYVDGTLLVELLRTTPATALALASLFRDGSRLLASGLIETAAPPLGHAPSQLELELVPAPRLLRVFEGKFGLDPRLRAFAALVPTVPDDSDPDALARLVELTTAVAEHPSYGRLHLLLAGGPGAGKLRTARVLGHRLGRRNLLVVESAYLPTEPARLTRLLDGLRLEAEIANAQLVFRRIEHAVDGGKAAVILRQAFGSRAIHGWATTDVDPARIDAPHLSDLAVLMHVVAAPDRRERRRAWQTALARTGVTLDDGDVRTLADDYPLARGAIEIAARLGHASASAASLASLTGAAESQMRSQLARFARRSRSTARLGNLVLPENTREQVDELMAALRTRSAVMEQWGLTQRHATGRGIVALFNGAPGTGKTMTASALANELELPLFRIDVSSLVDRYVGETEKNLVRMFEEAAASRAALLFDEADSLFGKRIEAEDATDRYANMQVNLLLTLIEEFDGLVVMTTNLKGALDDAFLRRIVYKIAFEMPERAELIALWDYHLPPSIPRGADVDLEALADEFEALAGGDIKNAVLRAALAAGGTAAVTQAQLRHAVISELRANGGVVADRR